MRPDMGWRTDRPGICNRKGRTSMTGERTIRVSDHAAGSGKQEELRLSLAVVLHLLPRVLIALFYVVVAPLVRGLGFPSLMKRR